MAPNKHGFGILEFPTLATSAAGARKLALKISNEMERVWVTDDGYVVHEINVHGKWKESDRYALEDGEPVNMFTNQGCRFCQEGAQALPALWRFCPRCGVAIRRRGRGHRTPTKS